MPGFGPQGGQVPHQQSPIQQYPQTGFGAVPPPQPMQPLEPPNATRQTSGQGGPGTPLCSQTTADKVHVAKDYMRKYYEKVLNDESGFVSDHSRARSKKLNIGEFELLGLIGRGAFGEVRLAYRKDDPTQTIVALKTLRKEYMIRKKQVLHVRAERELLVEARSQASFSNQWVVELYCTFQDEKNLYFVMEYCPGGDMMGWLIRYDTFDEQQARFYIAELILAVDSLHRMNYAHRDLKPDNILLDRSGHIKLTDFGLCKQATTKDPDEEIVAQHSSSEGSRGGTGSDPNGAGASGSPVAFGVSPPSHLGTVDERRHNWQRIRQRRDLFFSTVGSPGYIAPEVLSKRGYGLECDYWSVGVILYEMLFGYPPFFPEEGISVEQKILRWKTYLEFPMGGGAPTLSAAAIDVIRRLLSDAKDRITFPQLQAHPFFQGVDWSNIRNATAPFQIQLSSATDRRYFDSILEEQQHGGAAANQRRNGAEDDPALAQELQDSRYLFYGFTSKFNPQAQSNRTVMKRAVRPGLPTWDE
jgi:serine/threonine kinase 38